MRHDFTGIESNFAPKWPQHSQLTLAFLISPPLMAGLYGTRGKTGDRGKPSLTQLSE